MARDSLHGSKCASRNLENSSLGAKIATTTSCQWVYSLYHCDALMISHDAGKKKHMYFLRPSYQSKVKYSSNYLRLSNYCNTNMACIHIHTHTHIYIYIFLYTQQNAIDVLVLTHFPGDNDSVLMDILGAVNHPTVNHLDAPVASGQINLTFAGDATVT